MKRIYNILFAAILIFMTIHANEAFDTGLITWEQPNQVTFTARWWSDGFFGWMETDDGYRICKADDGYFYYAILDSMGEFTSSSNKVGIDPPLAESYKLERSTSREAEIDSMIANFEQELEQNYQEYLQKRAEAPYGRYFSSRVKYLFLIHPSANLQMQPLFR